MMFLIIDIIRKRIIILLPTFSFIYLNIAHPFEFDHRILVDMGIENVDLSGFSGANDQFSGEYSMDILINDQTVLYNEVIHLYIKDQVNTLCFTDELLQKLPIKEALVKRLDNEEIHLTDAGRCLNIHALDDEISVALDAQQQIIHISMPHIFLELIDTNWVPPYSRDIGISGFFLDYGLIATHSKFSRLYGDRTDNSFRINGIIGANFSKIRVRGDFQYNSKKYGDDNLEWSQRYAFMDIAQKNSKLFAGELYANSNLFDSVRIKGLSLYSDENMMPSYLKGYAPQVTGIANSNAIVTLRQYGSVIKSIQVPAGAFAIADLPSSLNGTIDVEIEESNGSIRQYQVDIAQVPFLTRKNAIRYSMNFGRLAPLNSHKIGTSLFMADVSYGLTDDLSLYGGLMFSTNKEYRAINIGLGVNLGIFGALSFDTTHSMNKAEDHHDKRGTSYRISYAKRFGRTTTLNLASYRFSSRHYTTINDYMDMKLSRWDDLHLEKNKITLSLSQQIDSIDTSISISATKRTYWNKQNRSNYNLSVNKHIKSGLFQNASIQLSLMHSTGYSGHSENIYGAFVTIPLGNDYHQRIQYDMSYDDKSRSVSQQATYYDQVLDGDVSLGVTAYHQRDFSGGVEYGLNASYNKDFAFGRAQIMANHSSDIKRLSGGFDGSITLTQHGITTHGRVFENGTRLIVDVGAPGVALGDEYNTSNMFGMVGISNIPTYYKTTYAINNDTLPEDVEIQNSIMQVAASDGAIIYRSLGAISGEKSLSTINLQDGTHPPFGAIVYRENGNNEEVAMVADSGLTYLTGLNKHASFLIKWDQNSVCRIKVDSLSPTDLQQLTCVME